VCPFGLTCSLKVPDRKVNINIKVSTTIVRLLTIMLMCLLGWLKGGHKLPFAPLDNVIIFGGGGGTTVLLGINHIHIPSLKEI